LYIRLLHRVQIQAHRKDINRTCFPGIRKDVRPHTENFMAARGEVKGAVEMRALVTRNFRGGKLSTAKKSG
jgi:hypothetical protein